jgi:hypothetical protein
MSYYSNIFIKHILLIINRTTKGYFYYSKDSIILEVMSEFAVEHGSSYLISLLFKEK